MGKTQDTTILVVTYIHGDADKGEEIANLKCELVRYLNLACLLTFMQARDKHGKEPLFTLEQLLHVDLINEEEFALLRSNQGVVMLSAVAYMWFLQLWLEVLREGYVPMIVAAPVHRAVQENISDARGAAADVSMFQSTPPPVGYFRVLYLLLNVSLAIAPFGIYATIQTGHRSGSFRRWMVVPVVFIITFFLLSFIHMCHEMFDPFSEGLSHFPLKTYLGSTMRASFALLEMPRTGRLRYQTLAHPPAADGSDFDTNSARMQLVEAEQNLHRGILRGTPSTMSMHLFGDLAMADPSERAALQDFQDGHTLMGLGAPRFIQRHSNWGRGHAGYPSSPSLPPYLETPRSDDNSPRSVLSARSIPIGTRSQRQGSHGSSPNRSRSSIN
mmetsp:Transcript_91033/g.237329  ORF Transcript_91033/g.237329 Transcript_91033/m.237329 type:complete len:386 (+) Transcript_91033:2-1159(+)